MTEHMIERYECDGCGWDGLDNQGPDGGCEAYFAERPDGGRNILCRWCVDHEPLARLAAAAVFPEQRKDDYLRATVVAQTTLRILRAWNEDEERVELHEAEDALVGRAAAWLKAKGVPEPWKADL